MAVERRGLGRGQGKDGGDEKELRIERALTLHFSSRQLWRGEGALQAQPPPEELGRYGACHALPILDIDNPSTSIRRGGGRQCSEERRSAGCSEQIDHLFVVW